MLRGTLRPRQESLQHYEDVIYVDLAYCDIVKDPFPTPQEAVLRLDLGGRTQQVFAPLRVVDEERGVVRASLVGEFENKILVIFPPTSFFVVQTRFYATEEELERIAVTED